MLLVTKWKSITGGPACCAAGSCVYALTLRKNRVGCCVRSDCPTWKMLKFFILIFFYFILVYLFIYFGDRVLEYSQDNPWTCYFPASSAQVLVFQVYTTLPCIDRAFNFVFIYLLNTGSVSMLHTYRKSLYRGNDWCTLTGLAVGRG